MLKLKAVLAVLLVLGGTGFMAYESGIINKPSFGVEDRGDWGEVTEDKIEITTTAWLNNDNPAKINLSNSRIRYNLVMNGVNLAKGSKEGIAIKEGNQTVEVQTVLMQKKIHTWWAKHLQNDEKSRLVVPIDLHAKLGPVPLTVNNVKYKDTITTNIEGIMDDSAQKMKGTYYGPQIPLLPNSSQPKIEVEGGSARFGKVTEERTNLIFTMNIHNPNSYPVPAPSLTGDLEMNNINIAEWDANDVQTLNIQDKTLEPGETQKIKFKAVIDNEKMDDWLTTHVKNNEKTSAELDLKLKFNLKDVTFTVPAGEGLQCSFDFQTGIFVDDQESDSSFNGCEAPTGSFKQPSGSDKDGSNGGNSDNSSSNPLDQLGGLQ